MGLTDALLDILYPPKCAVCGGLLERAREDLCPRCRRELPWVTAGPGKCDFVSRVTAPLYYEDQVREALLTYKFRGVPARGAAFGRLIAEDLRKRHLLDFDMITWVPLSRARRRKRGYDQARLLAEPVAKALGTGAAPALRKVRDIPAQSGINAPEARRANVSGVYAVTRPELVRGKRVLLVDDIITTGATVSECARMLMLAGAEEVFAAAVAVPRSGKYKKDKKDHKDTHEVTAV